MDNPVNLVLELLQKQKQMLSEKTEALYDLFAMCEDNDSMNMVYDLIARFSEMNEEIFNLCLLDISKHIISRGFDESSIGIVAMCFEDKPDSSQALVQKLKVALASKGYRKVEIFNSFKRIRKILETKSHIIIIDDFIGGGSTLKRRLKTLNGENKGVYNVSVHCYFVAGMEECINKLKEEGVDIYCAYPMKKGIRGYDSQEKQQCYVSKMKRLEAKLSPVIEETSLDKNSFGYSESEALFCRRFDNIPNNVFPIFWWRKDVNDQDRKVLYERVQDGY